MLVVLIVFTCYPIPKGLLWITNFGPKDYENKDKKCFKISRDSVEHY